MPNVKAQMSKPKSQMHNAHFQLLILPSTAAQHDCSTAAPIFPILHLDK
jgi:hypothetical protein